MAPFGITPPSAPLSKTFFLEPSQEFSQLFLPGEVVEGEMIEWIDADRAVIRFKGQDCLVRSQVPFPENLGGPFRVEATHPQLILRILPKEEKEVGPAWARRRQYLPNEVGNGSIEDLAKVLTELGGTTGPSLPPAVQDSLNRLLTLLKLFSISSHPPHDPDQVKTAVLRSGLFFEERLKRLIDSHPKDQGDQLIERDLKGLLIRLKSQWEAMSSSGAVPKDPSLLIEETGRAIDRILRKIEGYQFLNLPSSDSERKYFLLLPLWFQGRLRFMEMALSLPRRHPSGREQEGISILCLIDLPHLGKMSIEVKVKEKALYCRFSVSDRKASALLGPHLPDLQSRLVCLGFEPQLSLSVESTEKMTQTFFEEIGGERDPLLDTVV